MLHAFRRLHLPATGGIKEVWKLFDGAMDGRGVAQTIVIECYDNICLTRDVERAGACNKDIHSHIIHTIISDQQNP